MLYKQTNRWTLRTDRWLDKQTDRQKKERTQSFVKEVAKEQSIAGWNQTEPEVRLFDPNQTGLSIVKTAIGFGFSAQCNLKKKNSYGAHGAIRYDKSF